MLTFSPFSILSLYIFIQSFLFLKYCVFIGKIKWFQFGSVQSLSHVWLFATPWIAARQASLSITNSWSSLRLNVHRVCDAIQPSHPLSFPSPPAPNPSQHQSLFQGVNSSHEVAKVLEFHQQHQSLQYILFKRKVPVPFEYGVSHLGWTLWNILLNFK